MTSTPPSELLPDARNRATCHMAAFGGSLVVARPRMSAARAYEIATTVHRARPTSGTAGFRLYWMAGDAFGARSVPTGPHSYLVVGRHTQCDIPLVGDPTVALRHLLVRTVVLDDGCTCLAVLDLRTQGGFELSDGSTQRALLARGPIVLRVGIHALVALPVEGPLPDALPGVQSVAARGHPYRDAPAPPGPDPVARPHYQTHVTLLPPPSEIHESGWFDFGQPASDPRVYEVVLDAGARRARVCLSREDLERGVLVGRSDRCLDDGLRSVLSGTISRVHLLLLSGTRGCAAYDVASSQGTTARGRRVRCVELFDGGTELVLARDQSVRFRWRALA